jgi:hypothetical protein
MKGQGGARVGGYFFLSGWGWKQELRRNSVLLPGSEEISRGCCEGLCVLTTYLQVNDELI